MPRQTLWMFCKGCASMLGGSRLDSAWRFLTISAVDKMLAPRLQQKACWHQRFRITYDSFSCSRLFGLFRGRGLEPPFSPVPNLGRCRCVPARVDYKPMDARMCLSRCDFRSEAQGRIPPSPAQPNIQVTWPHIDPSTTRSHILHHSPSKVKLGRCRCTLGRQATSSHFRHLNPHGAWDINTKYAKHSRRCGRDRRPHSVPL